MRQNCVVGFLIVSLIGFRADVRLNFTVRDYENKNDLDIRLRKCETLSFLFDYCDPVFQFTVNVIGPGDESRLILKKEAGPFKNKKKISHVMEVSTEQRSFPNLLEIDLDIHDNDADEDQRIARFRRQMPFETTGKYALHMGVDVRVSVIVSVECAPNFYGPLCAVYCLEMPGLWRCNNMTGSRVCNKPCVHGSCVLTNTSAVCVCSFGWQGEICNRPAESRLIDSLYLPEEPELIFSRSPGKTVAPADQVTILPVIIDPTTPMSTSETTSTTAVYEATTELNQMVEVIAEMREATTVETLDYPLTYQRLDQDDSDLLQLYNGTTMVAKQAAGLEIKSPSTFLITSLTVVVIVIWLSVIATVGFICYKRHKIQNNSVYSAEIISYKISLERVNDPDLHLQQQL